MKNKLAKIIAFFLLLAFTLEATGGFWAKDFVPVELFEKEEKGKTKGAETEIEKEESKDKTTPHFCLQVEYQHAQLLFVAANTCFKYTVYLSLPLIPPDPA